jgi:hypothetical protein
MTLTETENACTYRSMLVKYGEEGIIYCYQIEHGFFLDYALQHSLFLLLVFINALVGDVNPDLRGMNFGRNYPRRGPTI